MVKNPVKFPIRHRVPYDELWKAIIEALFDDFLLFFLPKLHAETDLSRGHVFLEQELLKIYP